MTRPDVRAERALTQHGMGAARNVQSIGSRIATRPPGLPSVPCASPAAIAPPDDPARVRALCVLLRAPPTLADEINKAGLGFPHAFRLLNDAAAGDRYLGPLGAIAVQLALHSVAFARKSSKEVR
jgi:hypothetical protein